MSFETAPRPLDPVELAKEKVMPAEEYARIEHERPYTYKVEAGSKRISYFAPGHSWDPDNPVWKELKDTFSEAKPDMVLVEGFENLEARRKEIVEGVGKHSEADIIGKTGEAGLALKLAVDQGVDFDSPEPKFGDEIRHVEQQGFSRDAIFAYYFFRMVPQWQQHADRGDFKQFMQHEVEQIKRTSSWEGFDYSYQNAERIAHHFWGEGINLDDSEYYADKVDPIPWPEKKEQTEVNLVSRASSRFRDQYIVGKIAEALQQHNRIFIVYGTSHAVMQEPAIRELLKHYE